MAHYLVTRPQGKNEQLAEQLRVLGHQVSECPLLTLEPLELRSEQLGVLDNADIIIFVSQDAVNFLHQVKSQLPSHSTYFAVGETTANAFSAHYDLPITTPDEFTSEGLLALPQLSVVADKHIVIVKGKGGRATLAKTLKQRDAILNSINVYERLPSTKITPNVVASWQHQGVSHYILTSNASIDVLLDHDAIAESWLSQCHFYVVSQRSADYLAQRVNCELNIHVCQGATTEQIIAKVKEQFPTMNTEQETKQESSSEAKKSTPKANSVNTSATTTKQSRHLGTKITAALALLISLSTLGGLAYGYLIWKQEINKQQELQLQNEKLTQQVNALSQQIKATENSVKQKQAQQQKQFTSAQQKLSQYVKQQVVQAKQQQITLNPQEVNSLYRMAEFKALSERDYAGAAAILTRLDQLLAEHSGTSQIRQAINQDIQTLNGVQSVPVEDIYLTLHGLLQQVDSLALNMVQLPEIVDQVEKYELSEDVSDWRQNLKRSWGRLVDDFIKVRERSAPIEPLLSNKEQTLVKQQLRFYIAQAQHALMQQRRELYRVSLLQAQQTLAEYFDLSQSNNQALAEQIKMLNAMSLEFTPQFKLVTGAAIKEL